VTYSQMKQVGEAIDASVSSGPGGAEASKLMGTCAAGLLIAPFALTVLPIWGACKVTVLAAKGMHKILSAGDEDNDSGTQQAFDGAKDIANSVHDIAKGM
jgi:hypothetical protein